MRECKKATEFFLSVLDESLFISGEGYFLCGVLVDYHGGWVMLWKQKGGVVEGFNGGRENWLCQSKQKLV